MKKINLAQIPESSSTSPKGKYARALKDVSVALGRDPKSTDLEKRQPFDVQICRIPPGKSRCPYHLHTAQWEYFQVVSGAGAVRHKDGVDKIARDDAFLFGPGEPHQLINDGGDDLVIMIVADNPVGESCFYPDSRKWAVGAGTILRSEPADYFDGEE
jgi:uncharacterized cupin superfamily protein